MICTPPISALLWAVLGIILAVAATSQPIPATPCSSILQSAMYKSLYASSGGGSSATTSEYSTFLQAACRLPLPLPLPLATDNLADFDVAATTLLVSSSASSWEYPGLDYSASSFATTRVYQMVSDYTRAACSSDTAVSVCACTGMHVMTACMFGWNMHAMAPCAAADLLHCTSAYRYACMAYYCTCMHLIPVTRGLSSYMAHCELRPI